MTEHILLRKFLESLRMSEYGINGTNDDESRNKSMNSYEVSIEHEL